MNSNIEVQVNKAWGFYDKVDIYIIERVHEKIFLGNLKTGFLKFEEYKDDGTPAPATLSIPQSLMQKILDEWTKEVPPTKQSEIVGELKATKFHLNDLRKMLKIDG